MVGCIAGKAPQQEICSREDSPTQQGVSGAFLYHAGLSFRKVEPFVDWCSEPIRDSVPHKSSSISLN